ncbi:ArnT family glycosyltransferase [Robertkochia sediminum]|uniref:ArnT family glycosyltransferase n=1 Tax=Robertkochia sediminum TaxID=2785326 RepID=UPI001934433B|nr:glycosyltransferase family 39 protein [Robertkochia sediminum]MBL7472636.1 glycosyltransferase family 39 protein [Robertkochia sediminum]
MIALIEKHPFRFLILIASIIFLINLDVLYVNIMEARNFVTAREMLTEQNWVLTTMNDFPRYEKPPLPTWLTAISAKLFGVHNLFGLRLTAALSAIFLAGVVYNISDYLKKNTTYALYSGLILVTSFYIVFAGRNGQWDIYTHAFMTGAIYWLIRLFMDKDGTWKHALLAAVFFAASFLSKGPVSLYALWLPFMIAFITVYRKDFFKQKGLPFAAFLVLGLIAGVSWFVYVRFADPEAFLEITREETGNWSSYNVRPFWYYWSFFTQSGLWTLPAFTALLYPYLKSRVSDLKMYRFTLIWTLAAVVLLSIIPEKKSRYLLPVLIPLAMNTAFYAEYLVASFKSMTNWKEKLPVYLHFGLLALLGLAFPVGGYLFLGDNLQDHLLWFAVAAIVLFGLGVAFVSAMVNRDYAKLFYLSIFLIVAIVSFVLPLSKALYKNPQFNNIANYADKEEIRYSYGEPAPEMVWHLGHAAPDITHLADDQPPEADQFTILVTPSLEAEFKRIFAPDHTIELLETFDINYTAAPETKNYKDRLVSHYYLLKKK